MKAINDLIIKYQNVIRQYDKDESVIYLFIEHLTGKYKTDLLLEKYIAIDEDVLAQYVKAYCEGESVQYIINSANFYGRKFYVDNNVLIPRFETEEVVAKAIEVIKQHNIESVCDVGTGSGNIAITINLECGIEVVATDISMAALNVAKKNCQNLQAKVKFINGDLLTGVEDNIEMIISNPPYIPSDGYVHEETFNNEPHLALYGGDDGLVYYRKIIESAKDFKNLKFIVFEIGFDQGNQIKSLHENAKIYPDINGNDRIAVIDVRREYG